MPKLKQLQNQIRETLKKYPHTRNSDITLTIQVWQDFYSVGNVIKVEELYDLPREDTIKRIRAKFCEDLQPWAYPTDETVARQRQINEEEWRIALGYGQTALRL
jgi:hypothetical protein